MEQYAPDLHDHLSRWQIADLLEALIFTKASDWQRTVKIDRNVCDLIVRALRSQTSRPQPRERDDDNAGKNVHPQDHPPNTGNAKR